MIKIENIYKNFSDDNGITMALSNINIVINENEFVVVTGASGSGKSTLAKILAGFYSYDQGTIMYNGKDITKDGVFFTDVDYIGAENTFPPNYKVKDVINLVLLNQGVSKEEIKNTINDYLNKFRLIKKKNARIRDLSGGERQRVSLIVGILSNSKILIADEPTQSLDSDMALEVINIFSEIKNRTIIFITHKLEEVENIWTKLYQLDKGKIVDVKTNTHKAQIIEEETKRFKSNFFMLLILKLKYSFKSFLRDMSFIIPSLLFLILSICAISLFWSFQNNPNNDYFTSFNPGYEYFIDVVKEDKTIFSDSDINYLINNLDEDDLIVNPGFLYQQNQFEYKKDTGYGVERKWVISYDRLSSLKLLAGRMPEKKGEVVITALPVGDSYTNTINLIGDEEVFGYKVVGVLKEDKFFSSLIGVHPDDYIDFQKISYQHYIKVDSIDYPVYFKIDDTLGNNEIKTIISINNTSDISLGVKYLNYSYFIDNMTIVDNEEDDAIYFNDLILVNKETFDQLTETKTFSVGLSFENKGSMNKAIKKLQDEGYYVLVATSVKYPTNYVLMAITVLLLSIYMGVFFIKKDFRKTKIETNYWRLSNVKKINIFLFTLVIKTIFFTIVSLGTLLSLYSMLSSINFTDEGLYETFRYAKAWLSLNIIYLIFICYLIGLLGVVALIHRPRGEKPC